MFMDERKAFQRVNSGRLLGSNGEPSYSKIGRTLIGVGVNPNSNMGLAVINLGVCNLPPTFRTDIANKLLAHIEQYKGTWLQRHLPGGLQNSLLVLTSALHRFVPNEPQDD
ncbi:unnamed protein product [Timema podura]|uniref:Uncharacterized protein n=1 Tax=Timema podura TaxID=61482 RepID=A0ABN7P7D2_TIMPD|nr:unnamed protein product [Timema podura]